MMKFLVFLLATVCVTMVQTKNCKDIILQTLSASDLVTQSPFRAVYSMNSAFNCALDYYTMPVEGGTYTIGSTYINNANVLAQLQLTFDSSNKFDNVISCADNTPTNHQFLNASIQQNVGFCIFTCATDGIAMTDMRCMSRSSNFGTADWTDILASVAGVSGAPTAGTLQTCPPTSSSTCSSGFQLAAPPSSG